MKNIITPLLVTIVFTVSFVSCSDSVSTISPVAKEIAICCAEDINPDAISSQEVQSLLFMVEEEKLARDVYQYLGDLWNRKVFLNITPSEQSHMNAVNTLIAAYELNAPSTLIEAGVFENQDLRALYNQLTSRGQENLTEALLVGALIEEVDIQDLDSEISKVIEERPILSVYANLRAGSENHLRAFVKNLQKQGITYEPQILDETTYQSIIN